MQPEWRGSVVRKSPLSSVWETEERMLKTTYKDVEAIHAREVVREENRFEVQEEFIHT